MSEPSMFHGSRETTHIGGDYRIIGGNHNEWHMPPDESGIKILRQHIAPPALHNPKARSSAPRCYPGTRVNVIENITEWVSSVNSPDNSKCRILWLHGPLGSGKSAIAQTLAMRFASQDSRKLAGSFFFSRASASHRSDTAQNLIATLAHQLVCSISGVKDSSAVLGPVMNANPLIFEESLEDQIKSLIVEPFVEAVKGLEQYTGPRVVIIDGIDECTNPDTQRDIIIAIGAVIRDHELPLQFIITSRPELHLKKLFGSIEIKPISTHISLQDSQFNPGTDIAHYLRSELDRIWEESLPTKLDSYLGAIVDRSGCQFLYPSMVIEFIEKHLGQPPVRQLEIMANIPVVRGDPTSPFAELECIHDLLGGSVNEVTVETIYGRPYGACVYNQLLIDSREALFPYLFKLGSTDQLRELIRDGHDVYRAHIHHKRA